MDANTGISWFVTALPFLAACTLIDVALFFVALSRPVRAKDWQLWESIHI
jgi:hypothetical protein